MQRVILGVILVLALGVGLGAVASSHPYFAGHFTDFQVADSPCGPVATLHAAPFVWEGDIWTSYLCADNRQVMRKFLTVHIDRQPPTFIACPTGFVHTGDQQGCVPPNHPLAGR